jgi:hypothetical protein
MRDPIDTVRRLYAHYDIAFTTEAEERMRRFLSDNPKDKHGRHHYTLAQFGLDRDREAERYRAYRERHNL